MRKYGEEFKAEAVKKIFEGQSVASVARELGVGETLLHNWKKRKAAPSARDEFWANINRKLAGLNLGSADEEKIRASIAKHLSGNA